MLTSGSLPQPPGTRPSKEQRKIASGQDPSRVNPPLSLLATMTTEQNKDLVRLQFDRLNNGDVKGAASLWAPLSFNHGRRVDPQTIQTVYASLKQLEERHSPQEIVAEGEWVAVRTTCEGRHAAKPAIPVNSGVFSEVEPTGRKYTVQFSTCTCSGLSMERSLNTGLIVTISEPQSRLASN
jgi:hypothetical protein